MTGLPEEVDPTTAGADAPHSWVVGGGCRPLFDAVSDLAALGKFVLVLCGDKYIAR
ncbi:unnamed protein product [Ectocarpus sp. 12 AP-2014]